MEAGGDGQSLTFAQTEALLAQNDMAITGPHERRGKYCFNAKKTSSKGNQTRQLWSKPHHRLTRGMETPGSEAWMGFAGSVITEWSLKPKRKREASETPRASKRVKAAVPDGRAQNGRPRMKLTCKEVLQAAARDSVRHQRIFAALPQVLQDAIKIRRPQEEKDSEPMWRTIQWAQRQHARMLKNEDNVIKYAAHIVKLTDALRSRRLVDCLLMKRARQRVRSIRRNRSAHDEGPVGCGIEYCFGRSKWWYRNHNSQSADRLLTNSLVSFDPEVLTIDHVRKFARRARDCMHAGLPMRDRGLGCRDCHQEIQVPPQHAQY